jgi:hypothetical protein
MFTIEDRTAIRDHVLEMARSDTRIVAAAVVGSLALDEGDRWSDIDLTFAVRDGVPILEVLEYFTRDLLDRFAAVHLFDLPSGPTIYRVFLLDGCLQCDLSFTPASEFGALGPKFRLLYGQAVERTYSPAPAANQLFGYAVHHALHARFCIERGRHWQAEYWISALRDHALSLACRARRLPIHYGRGFDALPEDVRNRALKSLVNSPQKDELLRALKAAIDLLMGEVGEVENLAAQVGPHLREISSTW